jgi:SAM-dependent methyltransferase
MKKAEKIHRVLVNLGCGPWAKKTCWQDYDGSWNVLASRLPFGLGCLARKLLGHKSLGFPPHVRYLNITKRLPFADQSVDAVYFSHVLEHLHLDEGRRLLAECYRILKPDGIIRVLVPDTEYFLNNYLSKVSLLDAVACIELNKILGYRELTCRGNLLKRLYVSASDFHSHKFMYDRLFLKKCLLDVGFSSIEEIHFSRSRIPEIADVEIEHRAAKGIGFEAVRL